MRNVVKKQTGAGEWRTWKFEYIRTQEIENKTALRSYVIFPTFYISNCVLLHSVKGEKEIPC